MSEPLPWPTLTADEREAIRRRHEQAREDARQRARTDAKPDPRKPRTDRMG